MHHSQKLQKIFPVAEGDYAQGLSCSVEREYCPHCLKYIGPCGNPVWGTGNPSVLILVAYAVAVAEKAQVVAIGAHAGDHFIPNPCCYYAPCTTSSCSPLDPQPASCFHWRDFFDLCRPRPARRGSAPARGSRPLRRPGRRSP